ncbi:MAG: hypothetical protein M1269_08065 [Chloroflexi bacterium]|nr:hypothetical protein [Chloroflexota bacterium]
MSKKSNFLVGVGFSDPFYKYSYNNTHPGLSTSLKANPSGGGEFGSAEV